MLLRVASGNGIAGAQNVVLKSTDTELKFGVDGFYHFDLFCQTFWLTTTHISLIFVMITLVVLAIWANRIIKKANPYEKPGMALTVIEYIVDAFDGMAKAGPAATPSTRTWPTARRR